MPRDGVQLLAPLGDPQKLICVGLNYRDHCGEQGARVPTDPVIFNKFPSAIAGPFDDIVLPQESSVRTPPSPPPVTVSPLYTPTEPPCCPHSRWTGRWNWPPSSGRRGGTSR